MPQAPDHLRAMFSDDAAAWEALGFNFTDMAGLIQPKRGHQPTEREFHAIDYLCLEWDYGYDEVPKA